MKLTHQLPLALGCALLVSSGAGLVGVVQMNNAASTFEQLIKVDDAQAREVDDALVAFKNQVQNSKDIVLRGKDPKQFDKYWSQFQKYEEAAQTVTERLAGELPPGEARAKIERFNVLHQAMGKSIREIRTLIASSVERVGHGSAYANDAGATMTQIVGAIARVSIIVDEISRASAEQSVGVEQVGEAVNQMDQATQQNAALVEESAAAAESLKQQSAQLIECVARFRL